MKENKFSGRFKENDKKLEEKKNENYFDMMLSINEGYKENSLIMCTPKSTCLLGDKVIIMSLVCCLLQHALDNGQFDNEDLDIIINCLDK